MFGGSEGWRHKLAQLLHTHDTPQRTAAAYAIGVFFGFSPFLGLHTVLGLCVAFALNLNRVAVLVGVYSNLPWILPPYYTLTTLAGAALLRVEVPAGLLKELGATLTAGSWREMRQHAQALAPLALGLHTRVDPRGRPARSDCLSRLFGSDPHPPPAQGVRQVSKNT